MENAAWLENEEKRTSAVPAMVNVEFSVGETPNWRYPQLLTEENWSEEKRTSAVPAMVNVEFSVGETPNWRYPQLLTEETGLHSPIPHQVLFFISLRIAPGPKILDKKPAS